MIPKKPPGRELSVGEKLLNSLFSSARVVVEHVIAGVKRCRMVKDVLRLTTEGLSEKRVGRVLAVMEALIRDVEELMEKQPSSKSRDTAA